MKNRAAPAVKPILLPLHEGVMDARSFGSWTFGGLLLAFYIGFLILAPPILPDFKLKMLAILSGLLTGVFVFFIAGDVTTKFSAQISKGVQLGVQATGGVGLAVATVAWWSSSMGLVTASSQAATQLSSLLGNGAGSTALVTNPTDKSLTVQTSPEVRKLAAALAQSDLKYKNLGTLQADKISPQNFAAATAALFAAGEAAADLQALQVQFGKGIGPFRFGMSPAQVDALLPRSFGGIDWQGLPVARGYKNADVRYFWAPLSEFVTDGSGTSLYEALPAFHPCWSGKSYITFEFAAAQLVHLSVRLLPDCAAHVQLLQQLARQFSISHFDRDGPVAFHVKFNAVTAAGYTGKDLSSFDVFLTEPPRS
jgi:hypothetical protein